jgi:hypothetical protein
LYGACSYNLIGATWEFHIGCMIGNGCE